VATDPDGRITEFREKPTDAIPGDVNAGTYVLDPSALRAWPPDTYLWIEGEVFPTLIGDGVTMFGFGSSAYWLDLGTPEQYLRAHADLLAGKVEGRAYPAPWLGEGASVAPSAHLGTSVAVGAEARVAAGAAIDGSVLLAGSVVEEGARVLDSIVGSRGTVGAGASLVGCVLGDTVRVPPSEHLDGVRLSAGSAAH